MLEQPQDSFDEETPQEESSVYALKDLKLSPGHEELLERGIALPVDMLGPSALSGRDWLRVAQFVDNVILAPYDEELRYLDPKNPNIFEFISLLWSVDSRAIVQIVLTARKRIAGTAVTNIHTNFKDPTYKDVFNHLKVPEFILHSMVGVDPEFRRRGVFDKYLYPGLSDIAQAYANARGEIYEVLNIPPTDEDNMWIREMWLERGFEPVPDELQAKFPLQHLYKKRVKEVEAEA